MDYPLRPIKFYKDLHDSAGRRESRRFLVEGIRFVRQLMAADASRIDEILVMEDYADLIDDIPQSFRRRILSAQQYSSVSPNKSPQPVSAVVKLPADCLDHTLPVNHGTRILFLEDVQDPGNVGTLLRSAAGFGFDGAILTDKCADPFSPRAVAASAGAVLSLWIRRSSQWMDSIESCRNSGLHILAADMGGIDVSKLEVGPGFVLAMGNEGNGISDTLRRTADTIVSVPFFPDRIESLNVGAAGAVCMYELSKKPLANQILPSTR